MPNNEDYLDGLLNSITKVRTDSKEAEQLAIKERKARQENRNRISSTDDFLEANGLDHYESKPLSHNNLRKALSEADFLRDFEAELNEGDADKFLRDFDSKLQMGETENFSTEDTSGDSAELDAEFDQLLGDLSSDEFGLSDSESEENEELEVTGEHFKEPELIEEPDESEEPTLDSLDDTGFEISDSVEEPISDNAEVTEEDEGDKSIESLLAEAKQKMEGTDPEEEPLDENFEMPEIPDMPVSQDGEEVNLAASDDSEDTDDLMALLANSDSGDFGELSSLLDADESGEELDEAREEFENQVDSVENYDDDTAISLDGGEEKKPGFLQKLLGSFKKKKKSDEKTEDASSEEDLFADNEAINEARALDEENQMILSEMGEEPKEPELDPEDDGTGLIFNFFKKRKEKKAEEKAEKEAQPKPEKPKKEKKEKPKKEKKPPKPKKEKQPDTSPVIPMKSIIIVLILGVSIIAFVLIGTSLIGKQISVNRAKNYYDNGDYVSAYEELMGGSYNEEGEEILVKARLLTDLQSRITAYHNLYEIGKYDYALNQLLTGYSHYQKNLKEAESYGIADEYTALYNQIVDTLMSQFNVTQERAQEILRYTSRSQYTRAMRQVLRELDMLED